MTDIKYAAGAPVIKGTDNFGKINYSIEETPTQVGGSVVTSRTLDRWLQSTNAGTTTNNFKLIPQSGATLKNLTPTMCDLIGTQVTAKANGTATIEVSMSGVGKTEYSRAMVASGASITKAFVEWHGTATADQTGVTWTPSHQSLARQIWDETLALINGKTAATTTMNTWSITGASAVRNPSNFTAALDLSGWRSDGSFDTLVTPWHYLTADHSSGGRAGNTVTFRGTDGIYYTRTITNYVTIGSDIGIGILDSALPATVKPYKVLPANFRQYMPSTDGIAGIPAITISGHGLDHSNVETTIITNVSFSTIVKAIVANYPPIASLTPFDSWTKKNSPSQFAIGGDSNHPSFFLINGELVLLGNQYVTYGFAHYADFITEINAAITTLGAHGYALVTKDLSTYPIIT